MFNSTHIVIEAFVEELRAVYARTAQLIATVMRGSISSARGFSYRVILDRVALGAYP
jgi:hypothetical protein